MALSVSRHQCKKVELHLDHNLNNFWTKHIFCKDIIVLAKFRYSVKRQFWKEAICIYLFNKWIHIFFSIDSQLHVQWVPITTNVLSSNPTLGEMYSIQHYVINIVSDWQQVWGFSPGTLVTSSNKTDHQDIIDILLNVALHTTILTITPKRFNTTY